MEPIGVETHAINGQQRDLIANARFHRLRRLGRYALRLAHERLYALELIHKHKGKPLPLLKARRDQLIDRARKRRKGGRIAAFGRLTLWRNVAGLDHARYGEKPISRRCADPFDFRKASRRGDNESKGRLVQHNPPLLRLGFAREIEKAASARDPLTYLCPRLRLQMIEARRQPQPHLEPARVDALHLPGILRPLGLEGRPRKAGHAC